MRIGFFYGFMMVFAASAALAQPPEEVPPPPPETGVPTADQPAPAVQATPAPAPVAEAKPAPAPPEDKRIKGVELSPTIGVYPVGYDSINLTGDESSMYFFQLVPGIALSSSFKTANDHTVDLSISYAMTYREYFNKTTTRRDFANEVDGGMKIKWTDLITTGVDSMFYHFIKSGSDNGQDSGLIVDVQPNVQFTLNPQVSLKVGYQMQLVDNITTPLGPDGQTLITDPIDDVDSLRRGSLVSDATGFDNFGPTSFGAIPGNTNLTSPYGTTTLIWVDNRAFLGVTWKATASTTAGFTYRYVFGQISNSDNQNLKGHYFAPTVTQALPWPGGSVGLTDELRLRKYDYATVDGATAGTTVPRQNLRNRLTLTVSQDVNPYMSFDAWYRWQLVGENKSDYDLESNSWFYLGMIFKF